MKIYNQVNIFGLGDDDAIDIETIRQSGATAGFQSGYTDGYASYECEDIYRGMYLTFGIISGGTIVWKTNDASQAKTIEYSKNGGEWTSITSTIEGAEIEVETGDKVEFRGDNNYYSSGVTTGAGNYNTFGTLLFNSAITTAVFEVYGNIMSLINKTDFPNITEIQGGFGRLFRDCTGLTTAKNLVLPVTTLTEWCYGQMFGGCTSLTQAPELPATTLASYCYQNMFGDCTSLTAATELPATTLAEGCYDSMFYKCASLTTAPELPATTLTNYCYKSMFASCTSLTSAPELPATTLAQRCYGAMFQNCTGLTTAPELPATILANNCYMTMFGGCTSLTTAPELPATTLANYCYSNMFWDCTSLNYIKCLATDISATRCTSGWVGNILTNGTFVKDPNMSSWTTGMSGIPRNWTIVNAE